MKSTNIAKLFFATFGMAAFCGCLTGSVLTGFLFLKEADMLVSIDKVDGVEFIVRYSIIWGGIATLATFLTTLITIFEDWRRS